MSTVPPRGGRESRRIGSVMSDSWTHYDNLKVSPRADPEVIRAAYRALAQKWHPDKHPPERKARCERVMHLINDAYRVLSDPATRARYDESLAAQRADATAGRAHASGDTRAAAGAHPSRRLPARSQRRACPRGRIGFYKDSHAEHRRNVPPALEPDVPEDGAR